MIWGWILSIAIIAIISIIVAYLTTRLVVGGMVNTKLKAEAA